MTNQLHHKSITVAYSAYLRRSGVPSTRSSGRFPAAKLTNAAGAADRCRSHDWREAVSNWTRAQEIYLQKNTTGRYFSDWQDGGAKETGVPVQFLSKDPKVKAWSKWRHV